MESRTAGRRTASQSRGTRLRLVVAGALLTTIGAAGCSASTPGRAVAVSTSDAGAGDPAAAPSTTSSSSAAASSGASSSSASPSSPSSSAPAADPAATDGGPVIDPYYPDSGNLGYDVQGYRVQFTFDPATQDFSAQTIISAEVTGDALETVSFDLQDTMQVSKVTVNDADAPFEQSDAKLNITPDSAVDDDLTVIVDYAGTPGVIGGGTANLGDGGWYPLDSGGALVVGEPYSSSAWFPSNEIPSDKATFQVIGMIPDGWEMISNGLPTEDALPQPPDGYKAVGWAEKSEMATYLTTLYIEKFSVTESTTADGVPIINAYAPGAEEFKELGDKTGEYLSFLETIYGPYPFEAAGGIYTGLSTGFALENQTRPVYPDWVDESTVVHELAHQWYGDDVSVQNWADICLNECFASYASWQYDEYANGWDLDRTYLDQIADYQDIPGFWELPLVDMGAGNEFGDVYSRGPLALHALRAEMGDDAFGTLLKEWISEHGGGNATWSEFEAKVSEVAGRDLSGFMTAWFRDTGVPADEYLYPGDLHE